MSATVYKLLPAVPFWVGGLLRLPAARRSREAALLCAALLFLGAALTVDARPVFLAVDRALGVTNVSDLIEHVLTLVGATLLLIVLRDLLSERPHTLPRGQLVVATGVVVASAVLFLAAPLPVESPEFTARY